MFVWCLCGVCVVFVWCLLGNGRRLCTCELCIVYVILCTFEDVLLDSLIIRTFLDTQGLQQLTMKHSLYHLHIRRIEGGCNKPYANLGRLGW